MLTETEFYDQLAEFFDVMTDWESRLAVELPFIETTFAQYRVQSVLDCACGTGGHAVALAQRGYCVAGSDVSAGMIARARANAEHAGRTIPFAVVHFRDLRATFRERFDAVLCLGNSLPHVLTDDTALDSLANMRDCLREGGVLILHNLNYDQRWKEKPRWFAVNAGELHGRETLVWRFADYGNELITFNIALFTRGDGAARDHGRDSVADESWKRSVTMRDWSVQVQSTLQRPYQRAEIESLLHRAGFRETAFYGSLQGEAFDAARSPDLVVVAMA